MAKILENKTSELKGQAYRLIELRDAMEASHENLCKVMADQQDLLQLVKTNDKDHKFDDFIKESEDQLENLSKQATELERRTIIMTKVVEKMYSTKEFNDFTEMMLDGLGVFSGK